MSVLSSLVLRSIRTTSTQSGKGTTDLLFVVARRGSVHEGGRPSRISIVSRSPRSDRRARRDLRSRTGVLRGFCSRRRQVVPSSRG